MEEKHIISEFQIRVPRTIFYYVQKKVFISIVYNTGAGYDADVNFGVYIRTYTHMHMWNMHFKI